MMGKKWFVWLAVLLVLVSAVSAYNASYNNSLAFEKFGNGSVFEAVSDMYFGVMDYWWIVLFFVFTLAIIQITTKEEAATSIVGLMGSVFLLVYAPEGMPVGVHVIFYLIVVFSLAMFLYRIFGKGD